MVRTAVALSAALAALTACGRADPVRTLDAVAAAVPPRVAAASHTCALVGDTDGARAMCTAALLASGHPYHRVERVYRDGDTYCVLMYPNRPEERFDAGVGVRLSEGGELLGIVHAYDAWCPPSAYPRAVG